MTLTLGPATVFTSAIWQTTSTLVRTDAGVVAFDPTYFPAEVAAVRAACDHCSGQRHLVFTHSDWDHVVGAAEFEGFTTTAHAAVAGKDAAAQAKILGEITDFDARWYVPRPTPRRYPAVDHAITPDPEHHATLAGEEVVFVAAIGHTDDGLVTLFPRYRLGVAGDLLSALEFPFVYHDAAAYRATLDRVWSSLQRHGIDTLVVGHGPPAVGVAEIADRLDADRRYLDALLAARSDVEVTYRGAAIPLHLREFHERNLALSVTA